MALRLDSLFEFPESRRERGVPSRERRARMLKEWRGSEKGVGEGGVDRRNVVEVSSSRSSFIHVPMIRRCPGHACDTFDLGSAHT